MKTILFNPFRYVAGTRSLIFGIVILLSTAIIGFFSHAHFPDLISVKMGNHFPLDYLILQGVANWLIFSVIAYLLALLFSPSSVRIIDVFGTQAMARFPYFIAALFSFSGSLNKFLNYLSWSIMHIGSEVIISGLEIAVAIALMLLSMLMTVWMIVLMVNAYRVSVNLKGTKLTVAFLIAFVASMIITVFINKSILIPAFH